MRLWSRSLLLTLLVATFGAGSTFAHAYLDTSSPSANSVQTEPVTVVELHFSEGIEVSFSTFKVYRLDADVDLTADSASMRLNALAAVVVTNYNGTVEDGEGRVEATVGSGHDDKAIVTLTFEQPLEPGHYVVMWRVLSVDTHVVDGHIVFSVTD